MFRLVETNKRCLKHDLLDQESSTPPIHKVDIFEWTECNLCFANIGDYVLVLCGHAGMCKECAEKLTICPICRKVIVTRIKIYKSQCLWMRNLEYDSVLVQQYNSKMAVKQNKSLSLIFIYSNTMLVEQFTFNPPIRQTLRGGNNASLTSKLSCLLALGVRVYWHMNCQEYCDSLQKYTYQQAIPILLNRSKFNVTNW